MQDERIAKNSNLDRLTLWKQNIDSECLYQFRYPMTDRQILHGISEVVEDARLNFASASTSPSQVPLPIPPISRSSSQNRTNRSSRLPRKVLAASQIFANNEYANGSTSMSAFVTVDAPGVDKTLPALPSEGPSGAADFIAVTTPPRPRRATITSRSPEVLKTKTSFDINSGSPSKRKEKSKSQGNLLRPIVPFDRLGLEMHNGIHIYSLTTIKPVYSSQLLQRQCQKRLPGYHPFLIPACLLPLRSPP